MRTSHTLLLKYYHDPRYTFGDILVCYRDRGAPGDISCAAGTDIRHLDPYYMEVSREEGGLTSIPYHRIIRIEYRGRVVWGSGRPGDASCDGSGNEEKHG
jgi:uncharacterized protein